MLSPPARRDMLRAPLMLATESRRSGRPLATLVDGITPRMPNTRVQGAAGKDMELVPRPVDKLVVRSAGEAYGTRDSQRDAAVTELLGRMK